MPPLCLKYCFVKSQRTEIWWQILYITQEYQILTSFRLAGESSGYHLRIIDDFEPKSREDTKAYLSRVEKELLQDCPGANIILGPMVILMV